MGLDKPRLRGFLKKLRAIEGPADADQASIALQECLDAVAMLAGIKPVWQIGIDDTAWVEAAVAIAKAQGLRVVEAEAPWRIVDGAVMPPFPAWFDDATDATSTSVRFVCRSSGVEDRIMRAVQKGATAAESADLLRIPPCCVHAQCVREHATLQLQLTIAERMAPGDVAGKQRLLSDSVALTPETEQERALLDLILGDVAPFTSFYLCRGCSSDMSSLGFQISSEFADLAVAVSPAFALELGQVLSHIASSAEAETALQQGTPRTRLLPPGTREPGD